MSLLIINIIVALLIMYKTILSTKQNMES